ncbi:hypothetical protein HanPI659440_Chr03g0122721 [Helianthus annuus]|nr:hypothetical protein HanPI659440_Chr03g0122721 [Helianthus annuus]
MIFMFLTTMLVGGQRLYLIVLEVPTCQIYEELPTKAIASFAPMKNSGKIEDVTQFSCSKEDLYVWRRCY